MRIRLIIGYGCAFTSLTFSTARAHVDIEDTQTVNRVMTMKCANWVEAINSPSFTDAMAVKSAEVTNSAADVVAQAMAADVRSHQKDLVTGNYAISMSVLMFCQKHPRILFGDAVIDTVGILDGKGADPLNNPQDNPPIVLNPPAP